ncbi:MAG: hypothetical protein PHX75_01880 [Candidatus Methanomethylophilaceae archaeon]|nr:hypothetical protein [Candidatus Methanomethylophilaceae archaeon]
MVSESAIDYVLQEAAARCMEVKPRIVVGHPAEAMLRRSANHSLVICGSVGRTNISKTLLAAWRKGLQG